MIHNVFDKDLLTHYKEPQFQEQCIDPAPLPTIINKEEEYKVKVRKHRKQGWRTQYLVHWKGYRDKYDQWIAETVLSHTKETIKDYWTRILSQNL